MTKNILIAILVIVNILQLYKHSAITYIEEKQRIALIELSEINTSLEQNLLSLYRSNGAYVGDIILQDTLNNQMTMNDLTETNSLYCSISENYCGTCVTDAIKKIKHCVRIEKADRVIFLIKGWENSKTLRSVIDSYGIRDYNIYTYKGINAKCDLQGFPYYFMIDSNSCINKLYFPSKSTPIIDSLFIDRMLK